MPADLLHSSMKSSTMTAGIDDEMKVIVFEGVNGAGKSTVMSTVKDLLGSSPVTRCLAAIPAQLGPIGQIFQGHFADLTTQSSADADAILLTALRLEGAKHLPDILGSHDGGVVLFERWSVALAAYGRVDGVSSDLILELRAALARSLTVDLTILLDISGEIASRRLSEAGRTNRFEARGSTYLDAVAQSYRELCVEEDGVEVVDASGDPSTVKQAVIKVIAAKVTGLL